MAKVNFDRFMYEFLSRELGEKIGTISDKEGISIVLDDTTDVSRWIRDDNFHITVRYRAKSDISNYGKIIADAVRKLYVKNGVLRVFIEREKHEVEGNPQYWVSQLYVAVRRRSFSEWEV